MIAGGRQPPRGKVKGKAPQVQKPALEEDVRGRVLNAAVKLIDKGGLAGLSMREVARAAGISHQAPYHYFADREAIFAALAEEGFKILTLRLANALDTDEPAVERFVQAGRTYVEFALDHPALFRLMFRPDVVEMERFPEANACAERAFDVVPALVQACIAEGLPPEPNVQALVVLAWSIPHGLACLLLDGPLARKVPEAVVAREALIRDVMLAMRGMLVARAHSGPARAKPKRSEGNTDPSPAGKGAPRAPRRAR